MTLPTYLIERYAHGHWFALQQCADKQQSIAMFAALRDEHPGWTLRRVEVLNYRSGGVPDEGWHKSPALPVGA